MRPPITKEEEEEAILQQFDPLISRIEWVVEALFQVAGSTSAYPRTLPVRLLIIRERMRHAPMFAKKARGAMLARVKYLVEEIDGYTQAVEDLQKTRTELQEAILQINKNAQSMKQLKEQANRECEEAEARLEKEKERSKALARRLSAREESASVLSDVLG